MLAQVGALLHILMPMFGTFVLAQKEPPPHLQPITRFKNKAMFHIHNHPKSHKALSTYAGGVMEDRGWHVYACMLVCPFLRPMSKVQEPKCASTSAPQAAPTLGTASKNVLVD